MLEESAHPDDAIDRTSTGRVDTSRHEDNSVLLYQATLVPPHPALPPPGGEGARRVLVRGQFVSRVTHLALAPSSGCANLFRCQRNPSRRTRQTRQSVHAPFGNCPSRWKSCPVRSARQPSSRFIRATSGLHFPFDRKLFTIGALLAAVSHEPMIARWIRWHCLRLRRTLTS